jgi:hypothetical protein
MEKTSGYAFSTTQVATSLGYWNKLFDLDKERYGGDGSAVALLVTITIPHSTPWIVCGSCAPLIDADQQQARRYAAADRSPPGCGPADQMSAVMAAAYTWCLMFNEWPVSVQIGGRPITHDPEKGTRCDFCRRIVYGDEKFGMFGKTIYEQMIGKGARFVRTPMPCHADKDGEPFWVACASCIERSEAAAPTKTPKTTEKRAWWKVW